MFDFRHYVPILRWKRGEWVALKNLRKEDRSFITPMIELPPAKPNKNGIRKPMLEQLPDMVEQIADNWGTAPIFVDLGLIESTWRKQLKEHPFRIIRDLKATKLSGIVPVTGLSRDVDYQKAVARYVRARKTGACLRVHDSELDLPEIEARFNYLKSMIALPAKEIDIMVDCGVIKGLRPGLAKLCSRVPNINSWRTLIVAMGSFPKDLTGFTIGSHYLTRSDWLSWHKEIQMREQFERLPSYADFTTQHAVYYEPPFRANVSASIRYACSKNWLVMRGEGVLNAGGPGYSQWPANAKLLCKKKEFLGPGFSEGDHYIKRMSLQRDKTGNAETWLRAGINHHLTLVARQIAMISDEEVDHKP